MIKGPLANRYFLWRRHGVWLGIGGYLRSCSSKYCCCQVQPAMKVLSYFLRSHEATQISIVHRYCKLLVILNIVHELAVDGLVFRNMSVVVVLAAMILHSDWAYNVVKRPTLIDPSSEKLPLRPGLPTLLSKTACWAAMLLCTVGSPRNSSLSIWNMMYLKLQTLCIDRLALTRSKNNSLSAIRLLQSINYLKWLPDGFEDRPFIVWIMPQVVFDGLWRSSNDWYGRSLTDCSEKDTSTVVVLASFSRSVISTALNDCRAAYHHHQYRKQVVLIKLV